MTKKIKISLLMFLYVLLIGQVGVKSYEHDFGKVKPDDYVYHVFEIENTTKGKLVVENVQAG